MNITARELIAMPRETLWALPGKKLTIEMDDGVIKSSRNAAILSVYCWTIHQRYPKTPLLKRHHFGDRAFNASTVQDLINTLTWDCVDAYQQQVDREEIEAIVGRCINEIYNDFTYELEAHVQTFSFLDFVDIVEHPEIREIDEKLEPNHRSIDAAHRKTRKLLLDKDVFVDNPVAMGCQVGYLKVDQIVQCVMARGYVTDIDNNIFRTPIMRGYVQGLRKLHDLMTDSRTASKALGFTDEPLKKSQYFNRRLQILTDTVSDLEPIDCGSTDYLVWTLMPEQVEVFDGQYYLDEKTGGLRRFIAKSAAEEGLVGQTLKFRSVMHCKSGHPRGFCQTCYGELHWAVPAGTNPGHIACTKLGERITQILLSTKHLDRSASTSGLEISEENQRYIKYVEDRNVIMMSDRIECANVLLTIDKDEAGRLSDVLYVEDINLLQTTLVSGISRCQFTIRQKRGELNAIVPVSSGKRLAALSKEFLEYIKVKKWTLAPNGNYCIDMSDWDQDLPLFTLPLKNANMLDYMNTIVQFLMGTKSAVSNKSIKSCTTPDEALREFYAIVSTQLKINIVYLQVMMLACMIRSGSNHDYRLPLPGNTTSFGKFQTIIAGRSMSAVLAYEYQRAILNSPQTYLIKYRPNHPLDQIVEAEVRS